MTPQEFHDRMATILAEVNDIEQRHMDWDTEMERLLRSLGYGAGIEVMRNEERWWA